MQWNFMFFSAIGSDQNTAGEGCPRGEGKYCWHWNFKSRPSSSRQNWDLHKTLTNFGFLVQAMSSYLHQQFVNIGILDPGQAYQDRIEIYTENWPISEHEIQAKFWDLHQKITKIGISILGKIHSYVSRCIDIFWTVLECEIYVQF